jgi:zinc/manganese transport system permease protein
MFEMLNQPFMMQALLACLLLAVILAYFGVHVVSRCIVFIDLALAQISSAGVALSLITGGNPRLYATIFTLIGAFAFSVMQPRDKRVPQEAVIGIIYAVASAVAILLISKTPQADADVTAILFGNILAVTPEQLLEMTLVFVAIALFHGVFFKRFAGLTQSHLGEGSNSKSRPPLNLWNMLFYLSLALVISYAIQAAGVLLVFSYLIVPSVCAMILTQNTVWSFVLAMLLGMFTSFLGLWVSYTYDLPTGAAIVGCFGGVFLVSAIISTLGGNFFAGKTSAHKTESLNSPL